MLKNEKHFEKKVPNHLLRVKERYENIMYISESILIRNNK